MSGRSMFGGVGWQTTDDGVSIDGGPPERTPGAPVTMRRVLEHWGVTLRTTSYVTGVPLDLLMMTLGTEGALRAREDGISYPALREEPGYTSDEATPGRISFGPMHVTLATYRAAMQAPKAPREQATKLSNNLMAGALYIAAGHARTGWDPILVAARYNAGGLYDAGDPGNRFHNRWHLRCWVQGAYVHLDKAAQWYGDARAVLNELAESDPRYPAPRLADAGPPRLYPRYLDPVRAPQPPGE